MTRIRNIDKLPVRLPLTKVGCRAEDKSSSIWASGVHTVIIRVNTDEGIQGLGGTATLWAVSGKTEE